MVHISQVFVVQFHVFMCPSHRLDRCSLEAVLLQKLYRQCTNRGPIGGWLTISRLLYGIYNQHFEKSTDVSDDCTRAITGQFLLGCKKRGPAGRPLR